MKNPLIIIFIILILTALSCEKDRSGLIDTQGVPPYVTTAILNTYYLHIDTTSSGAVAHLTDGKYKITIALIAHVEDANGVSDIKQVSYRIYSPVSHDVIQRGNLSFLPDSSLPDEAVYNTNASFTMERSSTGIYIVEMFAQGQENSIGNSIQLSLLIAKNSGPPHIWNLSAQDTFVRPLHGRTLVYFRISASDPDGLADIDQVYFRNLSSVNSSTKNPLYDDGNFSTDGDSVAADGRYSTLLQVDSSNTLGSKLLRFYAIDKSGFLGDSLDHTITIIAQ